jgi:hypothetical protein
MKRNIPLTIASLLAIVLMTLHLADDIIRGMSPGGVVNMVGVLIFVVWLYGTVALAERRAGHVIMLLGGLFGAAVPVIHMRGAGLGGAIAKSEGGFFFVWTLIALGVAGSFAAILAVRGLWGARSGVPR